MSLSRRHATAWLPLLLVCPASVWAHGTLPGANLLVNGFLHPYLAPAHAISLVALALLVGGQEQGRKGSSMVSIIAGLVAGALMAGPLGDPNTDPLLLALALVCSLMVAFQRAGPRWWTSAVALALGTAVALGSGDPAFSGLQRLSLLGGACLGALVLVAQVAFCVDELLVRRRLGVALIAVRIVSSWMSAITLLLLALAVK